MCYLIKAAVGDRDGADDAAALFLPALDHQVVDGQNQAVAGPFPIVL